MLLPVRSAGFTFSVILLGLLGLYMCSQLGAIDRKVGRIANALDNLKGTQLTPIAAQAAPGRTEADFSPQVVSKPPLPLTTKHGHGPDSDTPGNSNTDGGGTAPGPVTAADADTLSARLRKTIDVSKWSMPRGSATAHQHRALTSLYELSLALQPCVAWRCDGWPGRYDCSRADELVRAFQPDRRLLPPREHLCNKSVAGAALPKLCLEERSAPLPVTHLTPDYLCSRTVVGDWEFDGSSANGQIDLMIFWLFFRGKGRPGTFMEFGAQNGVFASNTRFFERFLGWTGVLVEPVCHPLLAKYRPNSNNVHGAICNEKSILLPGPKLWCKEYNSELARGGATWETNVVTDDKGVQHQSMDTPCHNLRQLVDENFPSGLDFMSVDMEGAEMTALEQLNFTNALNGEPIPRIAVLLVEVLPEDGTSRRDLMARVGYENVFVGGRRGGDELFWHPKLVNVVE